MIRLPRFRFGKGILSKLVETVSQFVPDKQNATILDIGTGSTTLLFVSFLFEFFCLGNGHVIERLLKKGFVHLTGIDYSEKSIELARAQIQSQVKFQVVDLTAEEQSDLDYFDIGIDKGTLDAILLCPADQRKEKCQAYMNTVHRHIKNYLFLVSCNWTRTELLRFFELSKVLDRFVFSYSQRFF